MPSPTADEINQQASILMKRGIALLDTHMPAHLKEAVSHFDSAIALRRNLPLDANPLFRYGLAAAWINRGDALARLGSAENRDEALLSYDAALETLNGLEWDANPLFRRRLAIAWQNRGLLLQGQIDTQALREAGRSFEAAITMLLQGNAAEISDRDCLLATVRTNYANGLVCGKTIECVLQARTAAREAMALADQNQTDDVRMAEVGLKARHILCQAITRLLCEIGQTTFSRNDLIGEATDAAEDGMALARNWEQRGAKQFRSLAEGFFRFGARIYHTFQPHFFNEFLLEHLNPWPESPESSAE